MPVVRAMRFSVAAILAVACASDGPLAPPHGFAHAAATLACGPADGPAVAIYLTPNAVTSLEPSGPFVRVYFPGSLNEVVGKTWPLNGSNSEAAAWLSSTGPNAEVATSGYVILDSMGSDSTITGSVSLMFPKGGRIHGGFRAAWTPRTALCG
jgi:hypothetical protein